MDAATGARGDSSNQRPDGGLVDGGSRDSTIVTDGSKNFDASGGACTNHHDCEQGSFCHRGTCREDEELVYHCGKPGCPPGHWCVEADGKRSRCTEDLAYACESACDCGPAHCCIDHDENPDTPKRCIKDADDPYLPGLPSSTGATCKVGPDYTFEERDPTYCADDAIECLAARAAWEEDGDRTGTFLGFSVADGTATETCTAADCYGSACGCDPGESCVDTSSGDAGYQPSCFLGGVCLTHAAAESVFGWKPSELLDCCAEGCAPGAACEVTSMIDGNLARRLVSTCRAESDCVCGDKHCCPSELESCRSDCLPNHAVCGDGVCDLFESVTKCPVDCQEGCGDGTCCADRRCGLTESASDCKLDCAATCGDGRCTTADRTSVGGTCICTQDCFSGKCGLSFSSGWVCQPNGTRTYWAGGLGRAPQYSICGDGFCDYRGFGSPLEDDVYSTYTEHCSNCPQDCGKCL